MTLTEWLGIDGHGDTVAGGGVGWSALPITAPCPFSSLPLDYLRSKCLRSAHLSVATKTVFVREVRIEECQGEDLGNGGALASPGQAGKAQCWRV